MSRFKRLASTALSAAAFLAMSAAAAQRAPDEDVRLSDRELATYTGKFVLPNGVELALSVTSDTVVNGQLILRTVLTVDRTAQLQVFGRGQQPSGAAPTNGTAAASPQVAGVTIALDRHSGIQTLKPTLAVSQGSAVTVNGAAQGSGALGLVAVPVVAGGPALAVADGTVSVQTVRNGSQVNFVGDQLAITNLVGQSIASAIANSSNDRTIDTVTTVSIEARNLAPYQVGAAQMRVEAMAIDATRRSIR